MSPFSGTVLGGAAVLSAPALWASLVTGSAPMDEGLLRYIVAVVVCWVGLSVVGAMVGPAPRVSVSPGAPEDGPVNDRGPGAAGS